MLAGSWWEKLVRRGGGPILSRWRWYWAEAPGDLDWLKMEDLRTFFLLRFGEAIEGVELVIEGVARTTASIGEGMGGRKEGTGRVGGGGRI
jgi:hypothetical protein